MPGSEEPVDFMICLVPELCQLTGLTDDQKSNFRLMKDVATYTRITPNQRHAAFKKVSGNKLHDTSFFTVKSYKDVQKIRSSICINKYCFNSVFLTEAIVNEKRCYVLPYFSHR